MSVPPRSDREGWTIFVGLLLFMVLCLFVGVMLALGETGPK